MTKQQKLFLRAKRVVAPLFSFVVATACAKNGFESAAPLADNTSASVGCANFASDFYDQLYKFPQGKSSLPETTAVKAAFVTAATQSPKLAGLRAADADAIATELTSLYQLIAVDSLERLQARSPDEQLSALAALEIGDQTSPEKAELQSRIQAQLAKINSLAQAAGVSCAAPPASQPGTTPAAPGSPAASAPSPSAATLEPQAGTLFAAWKATQPRAVYGALKTMATAYQSCGATQLKSLDRETPDADGVKVIGMHPDGIGKKRVIGSITELLQTNPYLENYRRPDASCFDVTRNSLIYNYGGRPVTSSGIFDIFKSSGSGTNALGTDCSGYIYMSIASAGLRVKKGTPTKAVTINGVTSHMFMNPQANGLTCFDFIPVTTSEPLKSGDIIAKSGHVIMVRDVGADPFGVAAINNVKDCTVANMSVERFNFTVLQDSPYKGGIGIQSSKASDYLPEEPTMVTGLLEIAANVCKAKFGASSQAAHNSNVAITRHSGSADCMNASEIEIAHQSCVANCPATL